jgi:hypothetical protein
LASPIVAGRDRELEAFEAGAIDDLALTIGVSSAGRLRRDQLRRTRMLL